jgi:hypothetical protein
MRKLNSNELQPVYGGGCGCGSKGESGLFRKSVQ